MSARSPREDEPASGGRTSAVTIPRLANLVPKLIKPGNSSPRGSSLVTEDLLKRTLDSALDQQLIELRTSLDFFERKVMCRLDEIQAHHHREQAKSDGLSPALQLRKEPFNESMHEQWEEHLSQRPMGAVKKSQVSASRHKQKVMKMTHELHWSQASDRHFEEEDRVNFDDPSAHPLLQSADTALLSPQEPFPGRGLKYKAGQHGRRSYADEIREDIVEFENAMESCCQGLALRIVTNIWFDILCGVMIMANALWLGYEVDMENKQAFLPRSVSAFFCIFFVVEVMLRLLAFQCKFFRVHGWQWNIFDCALVFSQAAEEVIIFVVPQTTLAESLSQVNMNLLRVLRIVRLVRVLRMVRMVRFVAELRTLLVSIFGSIRFLMWTLILLGSVMYGFGICIRQIIVEGFDDLDDFDRCYGSLGTTVLILYQAITGGISWGEMVTPFWDRNSWVMTAVLCFYIAFCVFALLNVVTGVFVDRAMQAAEEDIDTVLVNGMCGLFDTYEGGFFEITWEQFQDVLDTPQMVDIFKAVNVSKTEARRLWELLDVDGSGTLDRDEFIAGLLRLRGNAKALDMMILMQETDGMNSYLSAKVHSISHKLTLLLNAQAASASSHSPIAEQAEEDAITRLVSMDAAMIRGMKVQTYAHSSGTKGSTTGLSE